MLKTRATEILGIDYPIMQGGLQHLGTPELASAVSNAGGLGTINATIYPTIKEFREAIIKMKALTDKPFCVNVSMLPDATLGELTVEYFEVVAEEGVKVVETSGRNPVDYYPKLKEAGVKLIHKVPTAKLAKKAESIGADIVSVVGFECAGHPSMEEITTMILGNKSSRTVNIPVLIGGGIADGRGLAAALALGGEGIIMGTRFVATKECIIHDNFKKWIVNANERDTALVQRSINNMLRAMNNTASQKALELERKGATLEELLPIISGRKGKESLLGGDLEGGIFAIGQAIGLINEIKSAREVIIDTVTEAEEVIARINSLVQ